MKAYKLIEVDVPSVIDAWVSVKETISTLVSQMATKVVDGILSAQEKCGQEVWSVKLHTDAPDPKVYLRINRKGRAVLANTQNGIVVLDDEQLLHPEKHWTVSLSKAQEIAKWLASVTAEDIDAAIATALQGSNN